MTKDRDWRSISPEESAVIAAVLQASGLPAGRKLMEELDGALVAHEADWILDVKIASSKSESDLPNGPFPARAYVPNEANYRGEVIVWIENGHLSGLEYAWVMDDPPARWPRPDEMEVNAQSGI